MSKVLSLCLLGNAIANLGEAVAEKKASSKVQDSSDTICLSDGAGGAIVDHQFMLAITTAEYP